MITQTQQKRYTVITNTVLVWITVVILGGFLLNIPKINILEHTARNLYFHVPMWFTLLAAAGFSGYHSYKSLRTGKFIHDIRAAEASRLGIFFGILGLITGSIWARYTWYVGQGIWWNFDPKQTLAAIGVLIYGAYFVLRSTIDVPQTRARISAAYNLFASATLPLLLYVLPRQLDSLHPGAEGNPAFSDITHPIMRLVFYPACIGFIGLFYVLYSQRVRVAQLKEQLAPQWEED